MTTRLLLRFSILEGVELKPRSRAQRPSLSLQGCRFVGSRYHTQPAGYRNLRSSTVLVHLLAKLMRMTALMRLQINQPTEHTDSKGHGRQMLSNLFNSSQMLIILYFRFSIICPCAHVRNLLGYRLQDPLFCHLQNMCRRTLRRTQGEQ